MLKHKIKDLPVDHPIRPFYNLEFFRKNVATLKANLESNIPSKLTNIFSPDELQNLSQFTQSLDMFDITNLDDLKSALQCAIET